MDSGISLSAAMILSATALAAVSGVPALFLIHRPGKGQLIAACILSLAGISGISGAILHLLKERTETFILTWSLPFGTAEIILDPLSCIFLIPIFLIGSCSAQYAVGYWPAGRERGSESRLCFSVGVLVASMAMVVTAANGALFMIVWELMALSSFFAMTVSDRDPKVREAGLVYLVATHLGTLLLFITFSHINLITGSFAFPAAASIDPTAKFSMLVFITGLVGFGAKAGLMPFHIWLPAAHASAPSHVSALMSGVMLKMGIYGIIRLLSFFAIPPIWWGVTILSLGMISGVVGVMFALGQHDIKRLLAYHSIENIGIIAIGIGLAVMGRSLNSPAMVLLGISGALLHTINHATFKALLFLGAGSVIHSCKTRDIDRMGGVTRRLPWSSACFLIGAVAICGLPPLNGFISELLVYLSAFNGLNATDSWLSALPAISAPALALIGTLAVACFVKVYGIAFLGLPRSPDAAEAHEGGIWMIAPMLILSFVCALIGIFPFLLPPLLEAAAFCWSPNLAISAVALSSLSPLGIVSVMNIALIFLLFSIAILFFRKLAKVPSGKSVTWDCGYLEPTPRMQYTSSSFAEMLTRLNGMFLWTIWHKPSLKGVFPAKSSFSTHVPEAVLELCYIPLLSKIQEIVSPLRRLQHGRLHLYVLYILVTLVLLLFWSNS